jgi:hypothetical protein
MHGEEGTSTLKPLRVRGKAMLRNCFVGKRDQPPSSHQVSLLSLEERFDELLKYNHK